MKKISGPQSNESLRSSMAAKHLGVILESSCQWQSQQKVVFTIWQNMWQLVFGSCFGCSLHSSTAAKHVESS